MAPFQYRLQPLLDLKLERRRAQEQALAQRQRELVTEEEALAELEQTQEAMKCKLAEALRARLNAGSQTDGHTLRLHTEYLRGLTADVQTGRGAVAAQRVRVGEFQDRVEEARRQLVEAARQVELLNKHRDRVEKSFLKGLERKAALEEDEMGGMIFNQRRRHESSH
jgi:flagellar biosynthesis chaperone FliJ